MGYFDYNENTQIISQNKARNNSVFMFDSIACEKQDMIREYFSTGTHGNIDCFYLCQSFARILKHLIKIMQRCIILFKQDTLSLRNLFNDNGNPDMTFQDFINIFGKC